MAGEATDLDSKKDIRGIATDFLTTVAGHLYARFAIADRVFDERNIPTYLKSGTRSLDRLDPELGLFDAQGHLIRSSPLVETVFDELRRRKDEDLDLDGKALAEHFEKIPFGWFESFLRLFEWPSSDTLKPSWRTVTESRLNRKNMQGWLMAQASNHSRSPKHRFSD